MATNIDYDAYNKVQSALFIIFLLLIFITNSGFLIKLVLRRRREPSLQKLLTLVSITSVDIVHAVFPFPLYVYNSFHPFWGTCSKLQLVTVGYEYYVPLVYCLGLVALMAELLLRPRLRAVGTSTSLVEMLSSLVYAGAPHLLGLLLVCSIYYGTFDPETCVIPRDVYLALTLICSVFPCVAVAALALVLFFLKVTPSRDGCPQPDNLRHAPGVMKPLPGKGDNSELTGRSDAAASKDGQIQPVKGEDSLLVSNVTEAQTAYLPFHPEAAAPDMTTPAGIQKEKITLLIVALVTSFCHLIHGVPVSIFFHRAVLESIDEFSYLILSGFTSWMSQLRPIITGLLWWLLC